MQPVAVFQIPAKGAAEARLLLAGCDLFIGGGGWRYQDRQQIDAGGKAIALLFYLIWLVSVFGNLPRSEFGPVVAQGGNVDVLLKALASVIESEAVASALNLFSMAAILSSFIGVGLGGSTIWRICSSSTTAAVAAPSRGPPPSCRHCCSHCCSRSAS
ncbi:low affinity tryptophan permease [Aeromonas encheleia]|nr:low affinity tryptophan permease [Aeromonas encheleia]